MPGRPKNKQTNIHEFAEDEPYLPLATPGTRPVVRQKATDPGVTPLKVTGEAEACLAVCGSEDVLTTGG